MRVYVFASMSSVRRTVECGTSNSDYASAHAFAASESAAPRRRELTLRQRLALVVGTGVAAEAVVAMADDEFDFDFFLANGVRAPLLKAAKITPAQLKDRGVRTVAQFRALEYGVLDLVDGAFCAACVAAYGADELLGEFLLTPNDAVVLAGSPAVHALGLDLGVLLVLCAGAPEMAAEVVAQTPPRGACLVGVAPDTLLDTGLRAGKLRELGFTPQALAEQTRASVLHLSKFGF